MSGLRFSKMHGAGNDFVVLDLRGGRPAPGAALCRALADRHTGVGCDQILTVEAPREAGSVASYRIWNADGSASGQCGNGARCVAAWLRRDGAAPTGAFALDSPAGTHAVEALPDGRLRVALGVPRFEPAAVPLVGFDAARETYRLRVEGREVAFGAVSMGNPHAVIEVPSVDDAPVAELGAALQRQPAFPESVNVGFAEVAGRDRIRLRVYERGVGETLACGSGASAAAAVLVRRGRVDRRVRVELPGGALDIDWPADDAGLTMAGPAAFVFEGEWIA
ncbi:diaminopimelate epimerase [Luteimonas huabeiensis]|uniref:diaminopimelate epimerase n=1 Tax=Luteimonas huabeiensis TaxID=1244513 RepID=UPI000467A668|nr:diaminopimelate epimerase [Luteimonas huabeiensis]